MTLANVSDVATELGRPTPSDGLVLAQWSSWIAQVETMIRGRVRDLDARIASEDLAAADVIGVEVRSVARKVKNPDPERQRSTTIDDGTLSKTVDTIASDGQLKISDEDWALLLPPSPVGSIRPGFEPDRPRWLW